MPKELLQARILSFAKQDSQARSHYEKARIFLEQKVKERAKDSGVHASLGLTYAGLGRKEEAIREGKTAAELLPLSRDAFMGPVPLVNLAEIYTAVGESEKALDQIEKLLSIPSWFSVNILKVDPRWDPLRTHPRYKQIVQKY